MKYMIASDIHGSALYCAQMFDRFNAENADRLILLGDLLYHGPRNDLPEGYAPKEVISLLNRYKDSLLCVGGNCEAEVDQMVLSFPVMAEFALLQIGRKNLIYLTHGHHVNEQAPPPLKTGDILMCGHTHVPACRRHETFTYMNPGSISIPKDDSCRSYMVLEGEKFLWKRLDDGGKYMDYTFHDAFSGNAWQ